ncbi:MAG: hypothetical protein R2942_00135 [Ignavibacteria bacterium]
MFVDDKNQEQFKTASYTLLGTQVGANLQFNSLMVTGLQVSVTLQMKNMWRL